MEYEYKLKNIEFVSDKYIKCTYTVITIIGLENEITINFSKEKLKWKTLEDLKNEKIKINFNEMDESEIEKLKKEYDDFDAKYTKD
jgi:hypothetical protein